MRMILGSVLLVFASTAMAQLGIISRAVTTTMDVRTKAEVTADAEISTTANKRLLDDKGSEWSGVKILVFAQHVVLAGAVKTDAVKKRVNEVVKGVPKIRTLKNELQVGDVGSLTKDTATDTEINARLTAAKGIGSVNMRWNTTGGRVVVMGVAESKEESALALKTIREVDGVKSVVSHLRVVPKKK
jgi:osmotically-inducible protein OsmY